MGEPAVLATAAARQVFGPIDRVENPSADDFVENYLIARKPVILRGEMAHFSGYGTWSHEFFRTRYGDDVVMVRQFPRRGGTAEEKIVRTRLADYIDTFATRSWPDPKRPPYLSDWSCVEEHPELLAGVRAPPYLPNWLDALPWRVRKKIPYFLVLIGPAGAVYNLHHDFMATHAWIAQFIGRKRLLLFPPDQASALYDGEVDPDDPDYEKYPKYMQVQGAVEAVLMPGEIVFIPAGWWHQVTSLDDSISVVCNVLNRTNLRDFLRDVRRSGRRPFSRLLQYVGLRRREYYF